MSQGLVTCWPPELTRPCWHAPRASLKEVGYRSDHRDVLEPGSQGCLNGEGRGFGRCVGAPWEMQQGK